MSLQLALVLFRFTCILRNLFCSVVYDLRKEYANPGRIVLCTPHSIPYIPLDHFKQNQWQHTNKRIPMMFEIMPKEMLDQMKKGKKKAKQKDEST